MASLTQRLGDLIIAVGTDYKQIRTWITGSSSGSLTSLTTNTKSDIISAINEVNAKPLPVDATETVKGLVELATLAEVSTGTDVARAVTPAGLRQERAAIRDEILGSGVPAALDTLDELAAALGDDANFGATVTAALANRVRVDVNNQGLTGTQQTNARTNISAVSSSAIGDPDTDLVALYVAAKA